MNIRYGSHLRGVAHWAALWGCLVAMLLFLSSCGSQDSVINQATANKILIKGNGTEVRSLDPHLVQSTTEHHVLTSLFEGLVDEHPSIDGQYEPGVAERWESLDGSRRWVFHLRRDAKWSDGAVVKASDFVFSYHRQLEPQTGALYVDMLFKLKGAQDYYQWKPEITKDNQTIANPVPRPSLDSVGVKALDDHTLELTLVGPMPYFLGMLTHYAWFPVPEHVIRRHGDPADRFNPWAREGNIVGNGAFQLKRWKFKQEIEVERNPYYWDAKTVKLNGIRFLPIVKDSTEERMFRSGRLHITQLVPLDLIPEYKKKYPDLLQLRPYLGVYFLRINVKPIDEKDATLAPARLEARKALGKKEVRWALALSVDRKALVENLLRGNQTPAFGLTPPMPGYDPVIALRHDPAEARRLLAEAGYPNGAGFPAFELHVSDTETNKVMAEALQEMWRVALNIPVKIRTEDASVFYDTQHRMDYELSRAGWISDYLDPLSFLDMWTTGNANNNTGWSRPEFDRLILESMQSEDDAKRKALLRQAEEMFMADMPTIPIYWYSRQFLLHPSVQGWHPKALDNHPYKHVDLVPAELPDIDFGN